MEPIVVAALVVAITICLLPCVLAWYFNFGGIAHVIRQKKALRKKEAAVEKAF